PVAGAVAPAVFGACPGCGAAALTPGWPPVCGACSPVFGALPWGWPVCVLPAVAGLAAVCGVWPVPGVGGWAALAAAPPGVAAGWVFGVEPVACGFGRLPGFCGLAALAAGRVETARAAGTFIAAVRGAVGGDPFSAASVVCRCCTAACCTVRACAA